MTLLEARNLPVWGFPWQSNPYCRVALGGQAVRSRRDDDTSHAGRHRAPVWNQEFQFLVENPNSQVGINPDFYKLRDQKFQLARVRTAGCLGPAEGRTGGV